MEPMRLVRRVPGVHSAAAWDPGLAVTGEIEAFDPVTPSFELFYGLTRDAVGRALAVTLHDAELAADAVDEAMARAYQHWDRVGHLANPAG